MPERHQKQRAAYVPKEASSPCYLALHQSYQRLKQCGGKKAGIWDVTSVHKGFHGLDTCLILPS